MFTGRTIRGSIAGPDSLDCRLSSPWWLAGAALVLFCTHLGRGLYIDEYTTWEITRWPLGRMLGQRLEAGHLPGYFLAMSGWVRVVGDSELALRFPSMLLTLGAVLVFRLWAGELLGARDGSLAGWLLALHQLTIWTAQTARPYAALLCAATLAGWCLTRYWERGEWRYLAGLAAVLAAGVLAQAMAALVLVSFLVAVAWGGRRRPARALASGAVMLGTLLIMLAPLAILGGDQANYAARRFGFPLGKGLNALGHVFFGDFDFWTHGSLPKYVCWLVVSGVLWGATLRLRLLEQPKGPAAFPLGPMLWSWMGITWVALIVVEGLQTKSTLGQERYFVHVLPAMALLTALGIGHWRERLAGGPGWRRHLPLAVCLLLMLPSSAGWLAQGGDGPHQLAQRLTDPPVYAGHPGPLHYEYRDRPTEVVDLSQLSAEEAARRLSGLAERYAGLWLFVYNNKADALDPLLTRPPLPWRAGETFAAGDARAALLTRPSDWPRR